MKVADGPDYYGYTIFCDDIRLEVGGKINYIGTYATGVINIHVPFPFVLSRLNLDIVYLQRRRDFIAPTEFIIALPGETEENASIRFGVPPGQIESILAAMKKADESEMLLVRLGGPVALTNVVLKEPGRIMVRVSRNDEYIRLGALRVLQGEIAAEANPPVAPPAPST